MDRLKLLLLVLLLIPTVAIGADSSGMIWVSGSGQAQCGRYLEFRNGGDADRRSEVTTAVQEWTAGYLAGYSTGKNNINLSADGSTVVAWVDKWCSDNPLGTVMGAVIALRKKISPK